NKYDAEYAIGRLGSWEVPSNVEELSEISTEMAIDGKPVKGKATLTKEQIKAIQYVFKDVTETNGDTVSHVEASS
ncbi:TPA: phage major tail protein, TP901-1 family, partial [Streptococcus agalactiae]